MIPRHLLAAVPLPDDLPTDGTPWVLLMADADGVRIEVPEACECFWYATVADAIEAIRGGPACHVYTNNRDPYVSAALLELLQ